MCQIISMARASRFCTSSTLASKFSIGQARIFISSKEIPRALQSVLESELKLMIIKASESAH